MKSNSMRAFFWFLLFLIYLLAARWYFICQVRQACVDDVEEEDFRLKTLQFKDGETVVLSGYDHFRFDSAALQPLVNTNNFDFLSRVGAYLKDNTDRNLVITGGLRLSEQSIQKGFYDNLGIARADQIRTMFIEQGIAQDRMTLDYQVDSTDQLRRPLSFSGVSTESEDGKGAFTFNNMTFSDANFEYNSAAFRPGPAFQNYADSVMTYFTAVDSVTLTIVGHTDSIATQTYNYRLGKLRADSARAYFTRLGLGNERIFTESRGEETPVAPNKTEEGRQKNRRVDIIIQ